MWILYAVLAFVAILVAVAVYDLTQRKHAILRNFPIIGHFRYWLEAIGPELRQYIVTDNDEERPFSRDHRRWIYSSAKKENNYFGFGTDNDLELSPNYLVVKHSVFPVDEPTDEDPLHPIPCEKILGARRGRAKAFRPSSVINTSAMSFGSLSAAAVEALNRGCAIAGCLQNTGEGGVAPHHDHGGDLIWQIGTGYFGARAEDGTLDIDRLCATCEQYPTIRAIEIKLSQGAKPGLGGVLPAAKITEEISKIRGIPMGRDCISPAAHTAFRDVDSMLDVVETIGDRTGLPVGIKSAVGDLGFWHDLCAQIERTDRSVDFVSIDGGEGGTGAAPLAFCDHVSLPFKVGFSRVFSVFAEHELDDGIVFIGSGRLGFPETSLLAMAMGCDMIAVAREAMLAIGCIQAQRCHSGHCPTGVATQNRWLVHGLDPTSKAARFANYASVLRKEMLRLSRACGVHHPTLVTLDQFAILSDRFEATSPAELFGYRPEWTTVSKSRRDALVELTRSGPSSRT